jgi:putative ABC transport system permease protein
MIYMIYLALPVLVLLVACTNLTNLVLSRGSSRRHEIAVRSALGGSRWRIVREQLTEGMLLGAAGGLGALLVTRAALVYLSQMIPATFGDQPNFQLGADLRPGAFAVAGLAGLLSLGLASLVPALRLSRANARSSLRSAAQQAAPRWRGRSFLIAVQVSVSVGLFLLTSFGFTALAHEGRGLLREGLDRVGQVDVPFSRQQIDEGRVQEIIDRVLRELATHPGIESVAATAMDPEQWARPTARVTSRERPMGDGIDDYRGEYAELAVSTPGVFDALSLRIASGRPFDERDAAGAPPVAVITESLAVQIFGTADAVGRQMLAAMQRLTAGFVETMPTQDLEIIGVAVDTPNGNGRAEHVLFVPLARQSGVDLALVARAAPEGDAAGAATLLATTLRRVAPDVAMSFAGPLTLGREWLGFAILRQATRVAGVLASIALVLSMTGLYGVLSHVVARRRREIGVRVALGASPREVAGLVLRQGARPVVLGLGIGLVAAALLRLGLQPLFKYDVTAVDPVAFVFAAGPLLAAAVVACYLPARRAARVDPNVALRDL